MKNTLKNINYKQKNFSVVDKLKFTINALMKISFSLLILVAATNNSFGQTWTTQTSGTTHELKFVSFTDANNGWAVGSGGTILKTFYPTCNFLSIIFWHIL